MVVGQNHNATNPIPVSERPHYRQQTVPTVPTVQTNPTSDLTINYPKIEQIQKATNLLPCDNLAHFTCDSYPFATTTCLPPGSAVAVFPGAVRQGPERISLQE